MPLEYLFAAILTVVSLRIFGHFERHAPVAPRILKWSVYLGTVVLLTTTVGRPWSLIWTFGFLGLGFAAHTAWCVAHRLNPFTAEPRERYLALRGWTRLEPPQE